MARIPMSKSDEMLRIVSGFRDIAVDDLEMPRNYWVAAEFEAVERLHTRFGGWSPKVWEQLERALLEFLFQYSQKTAPSGRVVVEMEEFVKEISPNKPH